MRVLTALDRARAGRGLSRFPPCGNGGLPTAAVMDAQAARSGTVGVAGQRGYDPARRVVGRKRHALVDTDGRRLAACVSPASLHDGHGGIALLRASREHWPFLQRCFANGAYAGPRVAGAAAIAVTVISAPLGQKGFAVQPRRWIIERSFAHAGRCRRLARDHASRPAPCALCPAGRRTSHPCPLWVRRSAVVQATQLAPLQAASTTRCVAAGVARRGVRNPVPGWPGRSAALRGRRCWRRGCRRCCRRQSTNSNACWSR